MEQLIVARHGEYGRDGGLNSIGRNQIVKLTGNIEFNILNEKGRKVILTSTAKRAMESAEIISRLLGIPVQEHEILQSGGPYDEDFPGTLELINSLTDDFDTIILMTHYEYVEGFPSFFSRESLGVPIHSRVINKGHAWIINCDDKTIKLIPS